VSRISPSGTTAIIAGSGAAGGGGDGGLAVNAQLSSPNGVAVDSANSVYISDYNNGRVRVVTPDGKIATFAGDGQYGSGGDGGPATQAQIAVLEDVAVDGARNVYIVTALTVREVGTDGIIHTVAGDPSCFGGAYTGDGGPAVSACLDAPNAAAVDSRGVLYIADSFNNRVRTVDPATGKSQPSPAPESEDSAVTAGPRFRRRSARRGALPSIRWETFIFQIWGIIESER
jgi:hypothetical protein